DVLLRSLGLPPDDADWFVPWVELFFNSLYHDDPAPILEVEQAIRGYFRVAFEDRRAQPRDVQTDFLTALLGWSLPERPLDDTERLDVCWNLVLAGMDTTRGQLGYTFLHFAQHPDDRRRLVADPALVSSAVEESLRYYSITIGDAKKVDRDTDFHGCP